MRTADSISFGGNITPPKGKYACRVINIDKGISQQKKTPFVEPTFSTESVDYEDYEFTDQIYVTEKTIGRLCLFARRVCGMPDNFELPDSDKEAANTVAKYIMENAVGKMCIVTIEENEEKFIPTSGPDMGRTITKMRRRVAFKGYENYKNESVPEQQQQINDDDLPF